jgi:hypothetical protein
MQEPKKKYAERKTLPINRQLHRELKSLCSQKGVFVKDEVENLIRSYIEQQQTKVSSSKKRAKAANE